MKTSDLPTYGYHLPVSCIDLKIQLAMLGCVPGGEDAEASREKDDEKADEDKDGSGSDAEEDSSDEDVDGAEMPESPVDVRENIKSKFLVEMPDDFYDFWKLCKKLNAEDPLGNFSFFVLLPSPVALSLSLILFCCWSILLTSFSLNLLFFCALLCSSGVFRAVKTGVF